MNDTEKIEELQRKIDELSTIVIRMKETVTLMEKAISSVGNTFVDYIKKNDNDIAMLNEAKELFTEFIKSSSQTLKYSNENTQAFLELINAVSDRVTALSDKIKQ
jgi:uncharacterized UPF0160 family protein